MKARMTVAVAASIALVAAMSGCSKDSAPPAASKSASSSSSASTSATSAAPAQPADYTALLIKGTDLVAPEVFTAGEATQNPSGNPGVATAFSNPDGTHVVGDTILILPDPAAATAALEAA